MADEQPGFLGRWARRKTDVRQGRPVDEPSVQAGKVPTAAGPVPAALPTPDAAAEPAPRATEPEKLLSLDDVKLLTQESDFRPFMAHNVESSVRNAAMKKLFTDPHYNVMDGLDIYISDYSIADPIPESMLRQMVGAKLLKIFGDEDDKADEADGANQIKETDPGSQSPALSAKQDAAEPAFSADSVADTEDFPARPQPMSGEVFASAVPPGSGTVQAAALPTQQNDAGRQEESLLTGGRPALP